MQGVRSTESRHPSTCSRLGPSVGDTSATASMPSLSSPAATIIAFARTFSSSALISCGVLAGLSGALVQYDSTYDSTDRDEQTVSAEGGEVRLVTATNATASSGPFGKRIATRSLRPTP